MKRRSFLALLLALLGIRPKVDSREVVLPMKPILPEGSIVGMDVGRAPSTFVVWVVVDGEVRWFIWEERTGQTVKFLSGPEEVR